MSRFAGQLFGSVPHTLVADPIPMPPGLPPNVADNPVRGNRVAFQFRGGSTTLLDTTTWYTLLRAEDKLEAYWQVTLSPVYRQSVGPTSVGMPPNALDGAPQVRMTWGGGGVTYQVQFEYPIAGTSFVIAGDNVMVEVRATDGVSVFTPQVLPAVNGWAAPTGAPTSVQPYVIGGLDAPLVGPFPLAPFARALLVSTDTAGATVTVTFTGSAGTQTIHVRNTDGVIRIPVPAFAATYTAIPSAGNVAVGLEMAFT